MATASSFDAILQIFKPGGITNVVATPNFLLAIDPDCYTAQWTEVQQGGLEKATFFVRKAYESTIDIVFGNWIVYAQGGGYLHANAAVGAGSITVDSLRAINLTDGSGNPVLNIQAGDPIVISDGVNTEQFVAATVTGSAPWTITLGAAPGVGSTTLLNAFNTGSTKICRLVYQGIIQRRVRNTDKSNVFQIQCLGMFNRYSNAIGNSVASVVDGATLIREILSSYSTTLPEIIYNSANTAASSLPVTTNAKDARISEILASILTQESSGSGSSPGTGGTSVVPSVLNFLNATDPTQQAIFVTTSVPVTPTTTDSTIATATAGSGTVTQTISDASGIRTVTGVLITVTPHGVGNCTINLVDNAGNHGSLTINVANAPMQTAGLVYAVGVGADRQVYHSLIPTSGAATKTVSVSTPSSLGDILAPLETTDTDGTTLINAAVVQGGQDGNGNPLRILVVDNYSKSVLNAWYEDVLHNSDITSEQELANWAAGQLAILAYPTTAAILNLTTSSMRITTRDLVLVTGFDDGSTLLINPLQIDYKVDPSTQVATAQITLGVLRAGVRDFVKDISLEKSIRTLYNSPRTNLQNSYVISGCRFSTSGANNFAITAGAVYYQGVIYEIPAFSGTVADGVSMYGAQVAGTSLGGTLPCIVPMPGITVLVPHHVNNTYAINYRGGPAIAQTTFLGVPVVKVYCNSGTITGFDQSMAPIGGVGSGNLKSLPVTGTPSRANGPTINSAAIGTPTGTTSTVFKQPISGTFGDWAANAQPDWFGSINLYRRDHANPTNITQVAGNLPVPSDGVTFSHVAELPAGEVEDIGISLVDQSGLHDTPKTWPTGWANIAATSIGSGTLSSLPSGFTFTAVATSGTYSGWHGSNSHFNVTITITQTGGGGTPADFLESIDVFHSPTGLGHWALGQHIKTSAFGAFTVHLTLPYGVSSDLAVRVNGLKPSSYSGPQICTTTDGSVPTTTANQLAGSDALLFGQTGYGIDLNTVPSGRANTMNPSDSSSALSLTVNNTEITHNATSAWAGTRSIGSVSSGQWYWEVSVIAASGANVVCGVGTSAESLGILLGSDANGWGYRGLNGNSYHSGVIASYGSTFVAGDIIGVALNLINGNLTFYRNGVSQGIAFTGLSGTLYPMVSLFDPSAEVIVNFGATPFTYIPPSGFTGFTFSRISATEVSTIGTVNRLHDGVNIRTAQHIADIISDNAGRGQADFGNSRIVNKTMDNVADTAGRVALAGSHASGNVAYNYKGVWSSVTAYVIGDEIVYGPSYWIAVSASTNSAPATNNANWQVIGTYSGYQGAWNSTTAYIAGAEVTYNNNYWVCLVANTNSAPTTSNANWQLAGPTSLDAVADGTTYSRPLATRISSGKPLIDFSESIHLNKSIDNIPDGATYVSLPVAKIYGTGTSKRARIDFSDAHDNKSFDNVPDGSTRGAVLNTVLTGNVPDLSKGILNKTLDNIVDTGTRSSILTSETDGAAGSRTIKQLTAGGVTRTVTTLAGVIGSDGTILNVPFSNTKVDVNGQTILTSTSQCQTAIQVAFATGQPFTMQASISKAAAADVFLFGVGDQTNGYFLRFDATQAYIYTYVAGVGARVGTSQTFTGDTNYHSCRLTIIPGSPNTIEISYANTYYRSTDSGLTLTTGTWPLFIRDANTALAKMMHFAASNSSFHRANVHSDYQNTVNIGGGIDLSSALHLNRTLDYISDSASYVSLAAGKIYGSGATKRARIDFTDAHDNKSVDNVPDGSSRSAILVTETNGSAGSRTIKQLNDGTNTRTAANVAAVVNGSGQVPNTTPIFALLPNSVPNTLSDVSLQFSTTTTSISLWVMNAAATGNPVWVPPDGSGNISPTNGGSSGSPLSTFTGLSSATSYWPVVYYNKATNTWTASLYSAAPTDAQIAPAVADGSILVIVATQNTANKIIPNGGSGGYTGGGGRRPIN